LLLHQGANYGYELVGALEPLGLGDMASGPVYRTLREMEAAGLVQSEWNTASSGGPARRVYRLTRAGHQNLADWAAYLRETDSVLHHFLLAQPVLCHWSARLGTSWLRAGLGLRVWLLRGATENPAMSAPGGAGASRPPSLASNAAPRLC